VRGGEEGSGGGCMGLRAGGKTGLGNASAGSSAHAGVHGAGGRGMRGQGRVSGREAREGEWATLYRWANGVDHGPQLQAADDLDLGRRPGDNGARRRPRGATVGGAGKGSHELPKDIAHKGTHGARRRRRESRALLRERLLSRSATDFPEPESKDRRLFEVHARSIDSHAFLSPRWRPSWRHDEWRSGPASQ
jgi:hypothetical protein